MIFCFFGIYLILDLHIVLSFMYEGMILCYSMYLITIIFYYLTIHVKFSFANRECGVHFVGLFLLGLGLGLSFLSPC